MKMKWQVSSILTLTFTLFAAATAAAKSPSACELLSANDVKTVQGTTFEEAKLTTSYPNEMVASQCFYRLPSFADSISLTVFRPASPSMDAEEIWEALVEQEGKGKEEEEAERAENHARKISGIGEEAFWSGNQMAGALYVLKGKAVLRISVGGAGTEKTKIEKSRQLAAMALRGLN
jgi:hypothetical protein